MARAPIYMGSLYARLDECVANITHSLGHYNIMSHVVSVFLQIFLWERIEAFAPTSVGYSAIVPGGAKVVNPTGTKSILVRCDGM